MIYQIKTYVDDEGRQVIEKTPTQHQTDVLVKSEYIGTATVETNVGVIPTQFLFPEDYTLEKCFEEFEKVADVEINKQIEAAKDQSRIITPDQMRKQ